MLKVVVPGDLAAIATLNLKIIKEDLGLRL